MEDAEESAVAETEPPTPAPAGVTEVRVNGNAVSSGSGSGSGSGSTRSGASSGSHQSGSTIIRDFSIRSLLHTTDSLRNSTIASKLSNVRVSYDVPNGMDSSVPHIVESGLLSPVDARGLVEFFNRKMAGIVALMDPRRNDYDSLIARPNARFLLAAICTIASRFTRPDLYDRLYEFVQDLVSMAANGDMAARLENCQALSCLAFWKHPHDSHG